MLDAMHSPNSEAAYDAALTGFLDWYRDHARGEVFSKGLVYGWRHCRRRSSPSTINLRLSAVKKLASEAQDNGLLDPTLATGIGRVKGIKRAGVRVCNWATKQQAEQLLNAPDAATLKGNRDRALLAVLVGCGLRRTELSCMTFDHIQQRDGRWVLVDLIGKGGRIRSVPMPGFAKAAIDARTVAAGISDGLIFRAMNNRHECTGNPLLAQNIMDAVISKERRSDRAA